MKKGALNQILCAALVDRNFRLGLLKDPLDAAAGGYLGQSFDLSPEEEDLLSGIKVEAFEEFAARVQAWREARPGRQCFQPKVSRQPEFASLRVLQMDTPSI